MLHDNLSRSQNMARRRQCEGDITNPDHLTIGQGLDSAGMFAPEPHGHDCKRLRRCKHMAMASASVIAVAVCNDCAVDRPVRIDVEFANAAVETLRSGMQPSRRILVRCHLRKPLVLAGTGHQCICR